MKTKFTPGPWGVAKWEGMWSVGAWSWGSSTSNNAITIIAQVSGCNGDPIANARLMASAPDLYAALKEIMDGRAMDSDLREQCKSALAKARGEQP